MSRYLDDREGDDALSTALRFLTRGPSEATLAELDDDERKELRRGLRQIRYWHRAGEITGFGIGLKQVQGRSTDQPACRIFVRRKRPRSRLRKLEQIPETLSLPGLATAVQLDVEELAPPEQVALGREQRPVFPGLSAGHCASGVTGTIGAKVRRSDRPGERFLLGASHVFALSGCARRGDVIVQPGGLHGGSCPRHTIGRLDDFVRPRAGQHFPNLADQDRGFCARGDKGSRNHCRQPQYFEHVGS